MSGMDTTLTDLAQLLDREGLLDGKTNMHDADTTVVTGADCDSRVAAAGHVFVCKGAAFKAVYLRDALDMGAVAYLCDASHADELAAAAPGIPVLVAPDDGLRRAMALVSAEAWGHPDRELPVLGMTGTKGKSTTAYMLRSIFAAGGRPCGILGSINTYDGVERFESHNTTPEAPDLWRHLANTRAAGLSAMVMEVSSQALKYDRTLGLRLRVGAFLNIGRDHISPLEHPDFEDYFASKLRIFDQCDTAVVNLGCDHLDRVLAAAQACDRLVTFSDTDPAADFWADHVATHEGTVGFVAHTPAWTANMHLGMPGLFNIENALCAIAIAQLAGAERAQIRDGLAACRVPGRMELVDSPDPARVAAIVDYAHNKLSYQRFFSSMAKEFPGRRIIAVLGAPGGKAQERRRELPQEASKWADALIYTEEDPAHERVEDINAEMLAATPADQRAESVPSRPDAIARAVDIAYEEDTPALVCLLAKGDETRQHVGDEFVPCETDAELFLRAMRHRGLHGHALCRHDHDAE